MSHLRRYLLKALRSPLCWLLFLTAIPYLLVVVPHWKPTWDSATYISLARALVHGEGYTYMGYPHTKYPPGFPLMLAPIELLFGHQFLLMRLLVASCAIGSVGMAFYLLRRRTSTGVAFLISITTAGSYALMLEATRVLTDAPYMLVSLVALSMAIHYREQPTRRNALLALLFIIAAYSIRIIGFTLALALATVLILHERQVSLRVRARRGLLVIGVIAAVVAIWMGRNALVTTHLPSELREALSYERELIVVDPNDPHSNVVVWEALVVRLRRNVDYYERLFANLVTSRQSQSDLLMHLLALLCVTGWLLAWRRRKGVMEYYTLYYLGVYLLWPSWQGERFLVPILPMLFYYLLQPLLWLLEQAESVELGAVNGRRYRELKERTIHYIALIGHVVPTTRRLILFALLLASIQLVFPGMLAFIHQERQEPYYQGDVADYIAAMHWVSDHSPPETVIITDRAPWAYLLTGRRSFTSPRVSNPEESLASIRKNGGTYLIANPRGYGQHYLQPVISAYPGSFRKLHQIGKTLVYEILAPPG